MNSKVIPNIKLNDYLYDLPKEKIAKFPLEERMESKLLVYRKGNIAHSRFFKLDHHLPADANLFFNDTRVIPARLHFKKETGAHIEIFLLEPTAPTTDIAAAMCVQNSCEWKCMVGNLKKWKNDLVLRSTIPLKGGIIELTASIKNREKQIVEFKWNSNQNFVDVIQASGKIPLPPYINREVNQADKERYQTIYSNHEGAVAAPTAGLHFDDKILENLKQKGINLNYLTLHVSAGTFQPIKEQNVLDHPMHSEQIIINLNNLNSIINNLNAIAVGTTAMRTLESLYWFGVKLLLTDETSFRIEKMFPYQFEDQNLPTTIVAIGAVKDFMISEGVSSLTGSTEIFIFPGYEFKICRGLITNYHLPGSTLILLVAAFIGADWKKIYDEALKNNYRFLSYGDSSLLIP